MIHAAYFVAMNSVTVAISKEGNNRNLKEPVTLSFLLFWTHTHTHTYIYRPVLYDVAGRVWGGLTANGRV